MNNERKGPFIMAAFVIVGCLAAGVWGSVSGRDMPSLVISVVLACGVAALLYSILGSVGEAGFKFGPVKMGGSAAVLVGSAYLFNMLLEPQLDALRQNEVQKAVAAASFDFDEHADPSEGWFAIRRETGAPLTVKFTDPAGLRKPKLVRPPNPASLRLKIGQREAGDGHLVSGVGTDDGLGYVNHRQLKETLGAFGELEPAVTYGPKRLHLVRAGALPEGKPRVWGLDTCVRNLLPLQIRVDRFYESAAVYNVRPCSSTDSVKSSLASGEAELHELTIDGRRRTFVIAVVAADHRTSPYWSSFLVIEMVERRG